MENLSPLQKLDVALNYLKDPSIPMKDFSTLMTFLNLKGYKFSKNDLIRITKKLIDDKYFIIDDKGYYHFTFEGYYFIGYVEKAKIESVLASRKNIRDFALTWGTVLAGIAGLGLLFCQIYSYTHPMPSPCDVLQHAKNK